MTPLMRYAAVALLAATLTACSNDSDQPTASTLAPSVATTTQTGSATTTSSTAPAVAIRTAADIQRVIAPLGLQCTDEDAALFCTRGTDSWQFRISPKGDGDAAFRKAACEAGAADYSEGALTDGGRFVVYAGNNGQDVDGFRGELTRLGIEDLTVVRGC